MHSLSSTAQTNGGADFLSIDMSSGQPTLSTVYGAPISKVAFPHFAYPLNNSYYNLVAKHLLSYDWQAEVTLRFRGPLERSVAGHGQSLASRARYV